MSWPYGRQRDGGIDRIRLPSEVEGSLFLCGKHAVAPDPERTRTRLGGDVIVVSFNEPGDIGRYRGYAEWLRESPDARWWPISDFHAPPLDEALRELDEVATLLRSGRSVLMHCSAGLGRAGTMAVGVLMVLGVPWSEALAQVGADRRGAGPQVGAQLDLVRALADHLPTGTAGR